MVTALITASFFPNAPQMINGIICCSLAIVTILINLIQEKKTHNAIAAVKNLDFETLGLLAGLFVVIGGLTNVGIIDDFANLIVKFGGNNIFLLYTIVVWGSVLISAFVDNIPYVATMLPVLTTVSFLWGLNRIFCTSDFCQAQPWAETLLLLVHLPILQQWECLEKKDIRCHFLSL